MGYNSYCLSQTCSLGCCDYQGYCATIKSACAFYYSDNTNNTIILPFNENCSGIINGRSVDITSGCYGSGSTTGGSSSSS